MSTYDSTNPKTNENEQEDTENSAKNYGISIENYICDGFSICREERQYAVFLSNILQKYRNPESREGEETKIQEIFEACGLEGNVVVEHVFYEATFMRDFFERNRRLRLSNKDEWEEKLKNKKFTPSKDKDSSKESFNEALIRYVCDWENENNITVTYSGAEHNLGQNEIEFNELYINGKKVLDKEKDQIKYRVRWMMNAKPDIAVIYHPFENKDQKKLLFLECKFESGESSYSYEDETGKHVMKQSEIQEKVADFLTKYLGDIEKEEKCTQLVKFVRKDKKEDNEIQIKDLININNEIFK